MELGVYWPLMVIGMLMACLSLLNLFNLYHERILAYARKTVKESAIVDSNSSAAAPRTEPMNDGAGNVPDVLEIPDVMNLDEYRKADH